MRVLGRRGGIAKKPTKPLRDYLRQELDPREIVAALRAGLHAEREADRLTAARLVLNEFYAADAAAKEEPAPDVDEYDFVPEQLTKAELAAFKRLLEKGRRNGAAA